MAGVSVENFFNFVRRNAGEKTQKDLATKANEIMENFKLDAPDPNFEKSLDAEMLRAFAPAEKRLWYVYTIKSIMEDHMDTKRPDITQIYDGVKKLASADDLDNSQFSFIMEAAVTTISKELVRDDNDKREDLAKALAIQATEFEKYKTLNDKARRIIIYKRLFCLVTATIAIALFLAQSTAYAVLAFPVAAIGGLLVTRERGFLDPLKQALRMLGASGYNNAKLFGILEGALACGVLFWEDIKVNPILEQVLKGAQRAFPVIAQELIGLVLMGGMPIYFYWNQIQQDHKNEHVMTRTFHDIFNLTKLVSLKEADKGTKLNDLQTLFAKMEQENPQEVKTGTFNRYKTSKDYDSFLGDFLQDMQDIWTHGRKDLTEGLTAIGETLTETVKKFPGLRFKNKPEEAEAEA
jgi:hypothetical protein